MHRNFFRLPSPNRRAPDQFSLPKENLEEHPIIYNKTSTKGCLIESSNVDRNCLKQNNFECDENIHEINNDCWKCDGKEYFVSLESNLKEYFPEFDYFERTQPFVTPYMRAILLDWMMEVCSEFMLKRETFHMAVNHLDRFLMSYGPVQKNEFQLVGLVSMYIASKIEEIFPPKLEDWVKSADEGYSQKAIKSMEVFMLRHIRWTVLPPTPFNYLNWLMSQWDSFIQYHFSCVPYNNCSDFKNLSSSEKAVQQKQYEKRMILFKAPNQLAYKRYRETLQILDASTLELHNLKPKFIAAGLLYLMICKYFFESNYELLYYNGPESEGRYKNVKNSFVDDNGTQISGEFNIESSSFVHELFASFVLECFEVVSIEEIYETVRVFHEIIDIEIDFALPIVCKAKTKVNLERHYGEFLTFQTHTSKNLEFASKRLRK
jgi:hypothetical protein